MNLNILYFSALFIMSVAANSAYAQASPQNVEALRADVLSSCAVVESPQQAAGCLVDMARFWFGARSNEPGVFEGSRYGSELISRVTKYHYNASCEEDVEEINRSLDGAVTQGATPAWRAAACDDAVETFAAATGREIIFRSCRKETYSYELLRDCISAVVDPDLVAESSRFLAMRMFRGEPWVAKLITAKDPRTQYLYDSLRTDQFAASIEKLARDDAENAIDNCMALNADQRDDAARSSGIARAFSGTQVGGPGGGSVNCIDLARAVVEVGLVSEATAGPLLGGMDLCAADRATNPPYPFEIRKASGEAAAGFFCQSDKVYFLAGELGRILTGFDVVGGQCKMNAAGLPTRSLSYNFIPDSCVVTEPGRAVCVGALRQFCDADQPDRAWLDCLSFNFEAPAAFHFAYDSSTCEWKSTEMGLDMHAVRMTGALQ